MDYIFLQANLGVMQHIYTFVNVGRDSEVWNQAGKHTMLNKLTHTYS